MIGQISIKTRFGWISAFEQNNKIIRVKFGKCKNKSTSKCLKEFNSSLNNFLSKKSKSLNFKFTLEGNSVQKKVWYELRKIKSGDTKSYGEIAKKLKLSPRHVGKICGQNKILLAVPCHRVIRSDGSMGGFSSAGGIKLKKKILNFEKN